MAGPDLVVDLRLLSRSARQLRSIRREFRDLDDWRDDVRSAVGARGVEAAMGQFADNWSTGRERLLASLDEVGKLVEGARDAFKKLDDDLSAASTAGKRP